MEWYTKTFNLRYSDVLEHEVPGRKVEPHGAFFRLDKGAEFVDHRALSRSAPIGPCDALTRPIPRLLLHAFGPTGYKDDDPSFFLRSTPYLHPASPCADLWRR